MSFGSGKGQTFVMVDGIVMHCRDVDVTVTLRHNNFAAGLKFQLDSIVGNDYVFKYGHRTLTLPKTHGKLTKRKQS